MRHEQRTDGKRGWLRKYHRRHYPPFVPINSPPQFRARTHTEPVPVSEIAGSTPRGRLDGREPAAAGPINPHTTLYGGPIDLKIPGIGRRT